MAEITEKVRGVEDVRKQLLKQIGEVDYNDLLTKVGDNKAFRDEISKIIQAADLSQLPGIENTMRNSLGEVVKSLTSEIDKVGAELEGFQTFNDIENNIIQSAANRIKMAEQALKEAEAIPNTWWQRNVNGRASKIANAKSELEAAKTDFPKAEAKAVSLRDQRIDNADITQNQMTIIRYSEAIIEIFSDVLRANNEKVEELKFVRVELQKAFENASKQLKVVKAAIEKKEKALQSAVDERANLVGEEAALQDGKIAQMEIEYEKLRSDERDLLAINNSSERFAGVLLGQVKSYEVSSGVIKALQTELISDTDVRVKSYPAAVQLIKAAKALRVGSNLQNAGKATDQKVLEVSAQILAMAGKNYMNRLNAHPEDMKNIVAVLEAIAKMTNDFREGTKKYQEIVDKGFSEKVDKKKSFSDNHIEEKK